MEIKKLDKSNLKEIYDLEQLAMTTDTTFPFTMDELEDTWVNGYEAYGVYDGDVLWQVRDLAKVESSESLCTWFINRTYYLLQYIVYGEN